MVIVISFVNPMLCGDSCDQEVKRAMLSGEMVRLYIVDPSQATLSELRRSEDVKLPAKGSAINVLGVLRDKWEHWVAEAINEVHSQHSCRTPSNQ